MYLVVKIKYRTYTLEKEQSFEKHFDLLQLLNSKNFHYPLIKDFDRLMTKKTRHYGEKHFFSISYNASVAQKSKIV